ncbi:MAG TPA: hypothetical protein DEA55_02450 [Rhodospirillaceae bacterium]|nr:hypothetical protein [Rhodospirillaceae bacterium]
MGEARLKIEKGVLRMLFADKVGSITGLHQKEILTPEEYVQDRMPRTGRHVVSINMGGKTRSFFGTVRDVVYELPSLVESKKGVQVSLIRKGHKNNGDKMSLENYVSHWYLYPF